jgi:dolichol-phosphate mannosyltransferase
LLLSPKIRYTKKSITRIYFTQMSALYLALLIFQGVPSLIFLSRLCKGATRQPPLTPLVTEPALLGKVSVVVPTLNEAHRIEPCLQGLSHQSYEVREVIVVDSYSTDGTADKVQARATFDPRFRVINDPPLPPDWVGRPWALHNGFLASSTQSEWILGIDADTQPVPGLVASLLKAAEKQGYDVLSLSPQFILQYPGEWWLQPALLMTLIYRFDSAGVKNQTPEQVMANGQCFLIRRRVLEELGGYSCAQNSFCDDVTLARYAAQKGFKVGFFDGAKVLKVRMYEGLAETWREWGRSLDLKDASSQGQLWLDLWVLLAVQGLNLPLTIILIVAGGQTLFFNLLLSLNLGLLLIRFAMLKAIAPSYQPPISPVFWLSPFADILAVARIFLSAQQQPKTWRGRNY